ncbi:lauroyl-KDO2-lipid IV(A) myristoyltransferase [Plasticicumulans lactativorans]|uniref:Lauroyl-KDO2-lipid IV(A) myristoyltransferase n=1 Tax=Plasticicumulans lactativorans TaxID=1133106 RepID=A0A4R2LBP6_9GAMM|nr:lipid A biosynthesis acyltransferase [Plasticicumulans lactativorans]TCO81725.1 lauroyl-KDO2-lipid IV(A) myristoyltransferase [Plasticicumulans lactativorans]
MSEVPSSCRALQGGPRFDRAWLAPRHWGGWTAAACAWLLWRLPRRVRDGLAAALAPLAWRLAKRQRRIADINLAVCFPELDAAARAALIRRHFRLALRIVMDYGLAWFGDEAAIRRGVRLHGEEHIAAAQAAGRRVIVMAVHALALDLGVCAFGVRHRALGPYKALENPVIDWLIARGRTRFKGTVFERDEGIRPVVRGFRDGQILFYLADEDLGPDSAVFVPFFALRKATLNTLGRLAKLGDAVVLPSITRLAADGRYDCHLLAPLADFPSGDVERDARAMNAAVEALVRPDPAQYMWTLRLFKTRPPGEPSLYRRAAPTPEE